MLIQFLLQYLQAMLLAGTECWPDAIFEGDLKLFAKLLSRGLIDMLSHLRVRVNSSF